MPTNQPSDPEELKRALIDHVAETWIRPVCSACDRELGDGEPVTLSAVFRGSAWLLVRTTCDDCEDRGEFQPIHATVSAAVRAEVDVEHGDGRHAPTLRPSLQAFRDDR